MFPLLFRSHDGFHEGPDGELIPDNAKYATQQKVFNDLGNDVLTSAYDGYNSTLVRKSDRQNERSHPLAMWPLRLRSSLFFFSRSACTAPVFSFPQFAYGQTGAGKSFSMVGYGVNKGIIPMVCSDMFKTVEKGEGGKKYQVMTTMLEIYNECIRVSWDKNDSGGGGSTSGMERGSDALMGE